MRRRIILPLAAVLALVAGAGTAVLATGATSTVTELITVPYSIAGTTGQVVLTDTDDVQTVTETQTVTVTSPPPTTTTTTTSPPPPTTVTPSQFSAMATSGATVENVTVTGDVRITNPNVTVRNVTVQGTIEFYPTADGNKLLGSRALDLLIWGADNLLVSGNVFDGQNNTLGGKMWALYGDVPQNISITNNTFKNQNTTSTDPSKHSQAIFVGYSDGVLISGNTFVNNGSTADIFFSWWTDSGANSSTTYPRNVCVKGNSFADPNDLHYYAINFRSEIKTSANIVTDPNEVGFSTTSPEFNGTC